MKSYGLALEFKNKYPMTMGFRLKKHCEIIDKHLNPDEEVKYLFYGQKNSGAFDFVNTYVIALTNQRLIMATKRLLYGYFFKSITPDLYNDLTVGSGIIWGKLLIDTVKEEVTITNLDKASLQEIETNITEVMGKLKKEYNIRRENKED